MMTTTMPDLAKKLYCTCCNLTMENKYKLHGFIAMKLHTTEPPTDKNQGFPLQFPRVYAFTSA